MIFIGIGSNLESTTYGKPLDIVHTSLVYLEKNNVKINHASPIYISSPQPKSDQSDYYNAVMEISIPKGWEAEDLLAVLHDIESKMGRERTTRNSARVIDLDLLDFHGEIKNFPETALKSSSPISSIAPDRLILPHPNLHNRAFVLFPLHDLFPDWRHPVSGISIKKLLPAVANQEIRKL